MTCDRCPISLLCLSGDITDKGTSGCIHCGRVWTNHSQIVFKCAQYAQFYGALSTERRQEILNRYRCTFCRPDADQRMSSGVPIIKHVYYDLDDERIHSV
jgi:hypothetical protein